MMILFVVLLCAVRLWLWFLYNVHIHAYYISFHVQQDAYIYIYIYHCNMYSVKLCAINKRDPASGINPLKTFHQIETFGRQDERRRRRLLEDREERGWPRWRKGVKNLCQLLPVVTVLITQMEVTENPWLKGSRKKNTKGPSQGPGKDCISGETEEFQHISGPINDVPRSKDGHATKNTLENTENSWLVGLFVGPCWCPRGKKTCFRKD